MRSSVQYSGHRKECFICYKAGGGLEKHHVFYGSGLRKISDREGFIVWLCPECHRTGRNSVHMNRNVDLLLKRYVQKRYEEKHTRDEFVSLIGRSYLD